MLRLILAFLLLSNACVAQTWTWATNAGRTGMGHTSVQRTAHASNGDLYVLGEYRTGARFGTDTLAPYGLTDIFLAKYNSSGQVQWAQKMGGSNAETAIGLSTDGAGNAILGFNFTGSVEVNGTNYNTRGLGDCIIAKVNASGQFQWVRKIGSSDHDVLGNLVTDMAGNTYLIGYNDDIDSAGCFSINGVEDTYVAKLDANGNCLWATLGGTDDEVSENKYALAVSPDGTRLAVTSAFLERAYFGSMTLVGDSGAGHQFSQAFVAVLNTGTGAWLWAKQIGGTGDDYGSAITIDSASFITVAGPTHSSSVRFGAISHPTRATGSNANSYVAHLDSAGNFVWASIATGSDMNSITDLEPTRDGDYYVAGIGADTAIFGTDSLSWSRTDNNPYIARIGGSTGTWQWVIPANEIQGCACGHETVRQIDLSVPRAGSLLFGSRYTDSARLGSIHLQGSLFFSSGSGNNQGYIGELMDFIPLLTSVSPTSGSTGTDVTITGARMGQTTKVTFNGTDAPFIIVSPTELRVTVPQGATTGVIKVTTSDGQANSPIVFRVTGPAAVGAALSVLEGIAPNPAHGSVKVFLKPSALPQTLQLTDALGRVVRSLQTGPNERQVEVPLDGLQPGLYSLRSGGRVYKLTVE